MNDFNWFLNNYDDLYKKYGHQFLVIKNKTVLGHYDSIRQAIDNTDGEPGTYIVQECNGDESAYTNYVLSMNLCSGIEQSYQGTKERPFFT